LKPVKQFRCGTQRLQRSPSRGGGADQGERMGCGVVLFPGGILQKGATAGSSGGKGRFEKKSSPTKMKGEPGRLLLKAISRSRL